MNWQRPLIKIWNYWRTRSPHVQIQWNRILPETREHSCKELIMKKTFRVTSKDNRSVFKQCSQLIKSEFLLPTRVWKELPNASLFSKVLESVIFMFQRHVSAKKVFEHARMQVIVVVDATSWAFDKGQVNCCGIDNPPRSLQFGCIMLFL